MSKTTPAFRLRHARAMRGLTQVQLAKSAGVSQSAIGNIESGTRGIGRIGVDLSRVLQVRTEWLISGEGRMFLSFPEKPVHPVISFFKRLFRWRNE